MNLREWGINSREFAKFIAENERASESVCKVLGIHGRLNCT